ncbi:hypothetical protein LJR010_000509 [Ensifer adhaerens]|uniref:hypothetical protein n=1 Tax=Ensifer adhaerens TaxID=106592 RepID=UPI00399B9540
MKMIILAASTALAAAPAAAADGVLYANVGNWQVTANHAEGNGAASCTASTYYPGVDTGMGIIITVDQQAFFMLRSPAIAKNLINDKAYTFTVYINDKYYSDIQGIVSGTDGSGIVSSVNINGLNTLMSARSIGIETGLFVIGKFNLQYSQAAITKAQECVAVFQHGGNLFDEQQEQLPALQGADPIVSRSF